MPGSPLVVFEGILVDGAMSATLFAVGPLAVPLITNGRLVLLLLIKRVPELSTYEWLSHHPQTIPICARHSPPVPCD